MADCFSKARSQIQNFYIYCLQSNQWQKPPLDSMSGELGFLGLEKSGISKAECPVDCKTFRLSDLTIIVQITVGRKECRLAVKHWTVASRRQYVRGIRLPITRLFWIWGRALSPTLLCHERRNDNRFCPDAVSATKQDLLTFACNLIWSKSDEIKVLSGSELPDTV